MKFKSMAEKLRRALLCCGDGDRKHSLEIGFPTDVRHLDAASSMQGLTDTQRALIREKVSADATHIHLFQHQHAHPSTSTNPTTSTSVSTTTTTHSPAHSPSHPPSTVPSFRSPSSTLLNSASTNLPTSLPTPPRHKHTESTLPHAAHRRMQSLWDTTRRLSASIGSVASRDGYLGLGREKDDDKKGSGEGLVLLNLDFEGSGYKGEDGRNEIGMERREVEVESPVSSGKSADMSIEGGGGFEHVAVIGGTPGRKMGRVGDSIVEIELKEKEKDIAVGDVEGDSSSDEAGSGERSRLVVAHAGV